MELRVHPKTRYVDDEDTVRWDVANEAAHSRDEGGRCATTLRITFTDRNPTTGPSEYTAPIHASGGNDTTICVTLTDNLSGSYPYLVEILDQYGDPIGEPIDPSLVVSSTGEVPTLSQCGIFFLTLLLLAAGTIAIIRRPKGPTAKVA